MGYTNSPKMGKMWYYIGMTGTLLLIIIWVTTRIPDNPITGRGGSISNIGFALFQLIYVIVNHIIVLKDRNVNRKRDVINSVNE
ncbi:MAG: hypothetical protein WB587_03890 [Nitrososphaeraceae archaeon]